MPKRELTECEKSRKKNLSEKLYFLKSIDINCQWKNVFDADSDDSEVTSQNGSEEENILSDAAKRLASSSDTYESSDSNNMEENYFKHLEPLVLSNNYDSCNFSSIPEVEVKVYADPNIVALDHNYCLVPKKRRRVDELLPKRKRRKSNRSNMR